MARIERRTTTSIVADELRKRILNGDIKEGAQVRQEAVAHELGVSRIPVREALRLLEAEGPDHARLPQGSRGDTLGTLRD